MTPADFPPRRRLAPLRRALLAWYDAHYRPLPWRETRDPYAILVSEFMLQQTQVATVLPYYDAFLARFPTAEALAGASDDAVRAAWSGLGYYRRARNLQAAARSMVRDHGGALPAGLDALRALPGVGEYTAAALGSIVHGLPRAVVDGNVIRVLTRMAAFGEPVERTAVRRALQDLADSLLEPARPGDWNQAVMELGATVCLPRRPLCPACPWGKDCRARAAGTVDRYPVKARARAPVAVTRVAAVLRRGEAVLLVRRRDPRLLDGTWEFPGIEIAPSEAPRPALAAWAAEWLGGEAEVGAELARVKHSITHRRITLRAFAVRPARMPRAARGSRMWLSPGGLGEYPVSSMTAKLVRALARPAPEGGR